MAKVICWGIVIALLLAALMSLGGAPAQQASEGTSEALYQAVMSQHAKNNHYNDKLSSQDIFDLIDAEATSIKKGWPGPCKPFEVYVCALATNANKADPNFGKPSPHVKIACSPDGDVYGVGIVGLNPPLGVFVTGFPGTRETLDWQVRRDKCVSGTVKDFLNAWSPAK